MEYVFRRAIRIEKGLDAFAVLPEDSLEDRLFIQVDADIKETHGWGRYLALYKRLFGEALDCKDLAEVIQTLFKLRNTIGHGRAINSLGPFGADHTTETSVFEWEDANHKHIADYLEKTNLVEQQTTGFPEPGNWFADSVADHFYTKAIEFVVELGLQSPINANLLWYEDAPDTEAIVLARLNGRTMPEDR